jgi:hypothetical protein
VTPTAFIETSPTARIIAAHRAWIRGAMMQKKHYSLAIAVAVAAVWIYAVGQSAGELLGLLTPVPEQRQALLAGAPNEPHELRHALNRDEESALAPAAAAGERLPAAEPTRAASPAAEPARPVYADAGFDTAADGTEPLDHPEVTDPHLRKKLRPAWDD